MVRKKYCVGNTVVEIAYLMPVILMMWIFVIFGLFYYHDKNILTGASYETAVVGSEMYHKDGSIEVGRLREYFQQRIRRKLLFFAGATVEIEQREEQVCVTASARDKRMHISVKKSAALTLPEEQIRKKIILKQRVQEVSE